MATAISKAVIVTMVSMEPNVKYHLVHNVGLTTAGTVASATVIPAVIVYSPIMDQIAEASIVFLAVKTMVHVMMATAIVPMDTLGGVVR